MSEEQQAQPPQPRDLLEENPMFGHAKARKSEKAKRKEARKNLVLDQIDPDNELGNSTDSEVQFGNLFGEEEAMDFSDSETSLAQGTEVASSLSGADRVTEVKEVVEVPTASLIDIGPEPTPEPQHILLSSWPGPPPPGTTRVEAGVSSPEHIQKSVHSQPQAPVYFKVVRPPLPPPTRPAPVRMPTPVQVSPVLAEWIEREVSKRVKDETRKMREEMIREVEDRMKRSKSPKVQRILSSPKPSTSAASSVASGSAVRSTAEKYHELTIEQLLTESAARPPKVNRARARAGLPFQWQFKDGSTLEDPAKVEPLRKAFMERERQQQRDHEARMSVDARLRLLNRGAYERRLDRSRSSGHRPTSESRSDSVQERREVRGRPEFRRPEPRSQGHRPDYRRPRTTEAESASCTALKKTPSVSAAETSTPTPLPEPCSSCKKCADTTCPVCHHKMLIKEVPREIVREVKVRIPTYIYREDGGAWYHEAGAEPYFVNKEVMEAASLQDNASAMGPNRVVGLTKEQAEQIAEQIRRDKESQMSTE